MFEKIRLGMASAIKSLLAIYPASGQKFTVQELLDHDGNVAVNKIWYRGDSYELKQLYTQIDDNKYSFWGARQTSGLEIRKIHTGLPKTMTDILVNAICADLEDVTFDDQGANDTWDDIAKENRFRDLVKKAVCQTFITGDGAFKISIDPAFSKFPIIEFYEADRIDVIRQHGRIREIVFKTPYDTRAGQYILLEHYGHGYVTYEAKDSGGRIMNPAEIPGLEDLQPITWKDDFMLAEYLSFYTSNKYEGRGQSIYDAKRDNFDALDEAWSQWIDALRAGRTKSYIPENLLPRDPNTGKILAGNSFDNRFIQLAASTSENNNGQITTVSPNIQHESYLATYVTALDLCLQGIISPSTLGIDTKKLDNAEAQREKEKATLYTRQTVVAALQDALPELIQTVFYALQTMQGQPIKEMGVDVPFGEYANPSFESQVETVGKAKTQGIMSIEASVDELYGDSRDDDWKADEVKRLKAEQGIAEMDEPAINMDVSDINVENTEGGKE